MNKYNLLFYILFFSIITCKKADNNLDDSIPNTPINFSINLALPSHNFLNNPGTFSIENHGTKGVFVIHNAFDSEFYAFDRTCSYRPLDACSLLEIDSSQLNFRCGFSKNSQFSECCGSKFNFDGVPILKPATRNLRRLLVTKSGNLLTISSY